MISDMCSCDSSFRTQLENSLQPLRSVLFIQVSRYNVTALDGGGGGGGAGATMQYPPTTVLARVLVAMSPSLIPRLSTACGNMASL